MHKKLNHFVEFNNILYIKQFGFRKNNSTVNALTKITEKIKESIDKGKYGCGNFIEGTSLIYVKPSIQLIMIFCFSKWNIME